MRIFLLLVISLFYLKAEDFITEMEYARMLYSNPRGIGCNLCHGQRGEGSVIATYKDKGKKKVLKAPAINELSKEDFFKALKKPKSVMPKYFLTKKEIEVLYLYVTSEVNQ